MFSSTRTSPIGSEEERGETEEQIGDHEKSKMEQLVTK